MKKLALVLAVIVLMLSFVSCDRNQQNDDEKNKEHIEKVDDKTQEVPEIKTATITLYFPDVDALYLHPELREVEIKENAHPASIVLEQLFAGPCDEQLSPSLDGENLVKSVVVENGLCTVDFYDDFKLLNSGGSTKETFAIGSIVNSLCALDDVDKVKININGNTNAEFGGHFTLDAPFTAQNDLVRQ